MRQLHSDFHFRHALFALQSPDGYVDALLESARDGSAPRPAAIASRRARRPGVDAQTAQAKRL